MGKNNRDRQKDCKSRTEGYNMSLQSYCMAYTNSLGTISVNVIWISTLYYPIQNNLHSFLNPASFTYIQKVGGLYGYPQGSPFWNNGTCTSYFKTILAWISLHM